MHEGTARFPRSVHRLTAFLSQVKGGIRDLSLGQEVIGKHSNGWFYRCTITGIGSQSFYEVNFDDGSYCDNVFPENLLVSEGNVGIAFILYLWLKSETRSCWFYELRYFLLESRLLAKRPSGTRGTCSRQDDGRSSPQRLFC